MEYYSDQVLIAPKSMPIVLEERNGIKASILKKRGNNRSKRLVRQFTW